MKVKLHTFKHTKKLFEDLVTLISLNVEKDYGKTRRDRLRLGKVKWVAWSIYYIKGKNVVIYLSKTNKCSLSKSMLPSILIEDLVSGKRFAYYGNNYLKTNAYIKDSILGWLQKTLDSIEPSLSYKNGNCA